MPRILLIISIFVFVGLACKNGANLTSNNTNTGNNNLRAEDTRPNSTGDQGVGSGDQGVRTGDSRTVAGGLLNDKAVDLPKPSYPPVARAVKASGKVVVNIEVAPDGSVVKAEAESGHPLLKAAAAAAARLARFKPGPSPISGTLEYEFTAP